MANIQNDIFENQEYAAQTGKFNIAKTGEINCAGITVNNGIDTTSLKFSGVSFAGLTKEGREYTNGSEGSTSVTSEVSGMVVKFDKYDYIDPESLIGCTISATGVPTKVITEDDIYEEDEGAYSVYQLVLLISEGEYEGLGRGMYVFSQILDEEGQVQQNIEYTISDKTTVQKINEMFLPEQSGGAQAFNFDADNFTIISKSTNETNTIDAENTVIAMTPSASGNEIECSYSFIGGCPQNNTINTDYGIVLSCEPSSTYKGSNNIIIKSAGGNSSIDALTSSSTIIGGAGSITMTNGGYNKLALNSGLGSSINASDVTLISSYAEVNAPNNIFIGGSTQKSTVNAANTISLLSGSAGGNTLGGSNHILLASSGGQTIGAEAGYDILISSIGGNTVNGGYNTLFTTSGGNSISGAYNTIISGQGGVTIPASVSNVCVIGCDGSATIDEGNMTYVKDLKAKVGTKYYKFSQIVNALITAGLLE